MFSSDLRASAAALLAEARAAKAFFCTAESCTGGLVAALLTEISGSSDVFLGGHVTYANAAKETFLGVPAELLKKYGAVSEEVARAMAEGAAVAYRPLVDKNATLISVAITGIAGPDGGSAEKPVGLVHLASSRGTDTLHQKKFYHGFRHNIRMAAAEDALALLRDQIEQAL